MGEICLDDTEFHTLHLNRCTPFTLYERLRPCRQFKDGVFHGSIKSSEEGYQELVIHNLYNLYQFSQITTDEIAYQDEIPYLESRFFTRRSEAVKELNNVDKLGEVIGYCFNGTSFHLDDKENIIKYFAENVYFPLIKDKKEWKEVEKLLKEGGKVVSSSTFLEKLFSYL